MRSIARALVRRALHAARSPARAVPLRVRRRVPLAALLAPMLVPAAATATPLPRPAYLATVPDTALGTVITRIADDTGHPTTPILGTWGSDARHVYSTQQPWNADATLLLIENRGGSPKRLLLDGATYRPLSGTCPGGGLYDFRWHPSPRHAHELINVDSSGTELSWFDVTTCAKTRSWTLPLVAKYGIGSGAGNPSNDGRFVAIGNDSAMVVVDMDPQPPDAPYPNRRFGPIYTFPPCSLLTGDPTACIVSHLGVSSSGRYVVVKYSGGSDTTVDMHRIYEVDPATLAVRPHPMSPSSLRCGSFAGRPNGWIFPLKHSDTALNPFDGNEDVLIGGRACPGASMGRVVMVRLRDGKVTPLTDPNNEASVSHVSTRNLARPGWAYVGYLALDGKRFSDEMVAVKMDGSFTVERYGRQHSAATGCYRCEPHPVPSPDGGRVLFASNWAQDCDSGCGTATDIKDYVSTQAVLPPPGGFGLAIESVHPNPTFEPPSVVYTLPGPEPARFEVVDVSGRRVLEVDLGAPGAGRHVIRLEPRTVPPVGIYWLRLVQAGRAATAKVAFLHPDS